MTRADCSGTALNRRDAAIVKGMLARGDRQHDIAAWFGVNGGRVADISTGKTFQHVPAQHDDLPPPGPYAHGRELAGMKRDMKEFIDELLKITIRFEQKLAEFK